MAIPYRVVLATGKPEIVARQTLYSLFMVPPLTFVSVYYWGLAGAGLGWVLYFLFCYIYSVPRICGECIGKPAWFFFRHLLKIFLLTALTYGASYSFLVTADTFTLFSLSLAYIGATVFFLIGAFFLISHELRNIVLERCGTIANHFNLLKNT
jgi:hypothetical protein